MASFDKDLVVRNYLALVVLMTGAYSNKIQHSRFLINKGCSYDREPFESTTVHSWEECTLACDALARCASVEATPEEGGKVRCDFMDSVEDNPDNLVCDGGSQRYMSKYHLLCPMMPLRYTIEYTARTQYIEPRR